MSRPVQRWSGRATSCVPIRFRDREAARPSSGYTAHVDGLLRQLYAEAAAEDRTAAVFALGGYGRRHLCLYSDIDLLVLFPGDHRPRPGGVPPRISASTVGPGSVVVGHQVREADEFETLDTDNPEFLLALLDARPVAGRRDLFDRFAAAFHRPGTHAFILNSLLELIEQRHAHFNGTLYQLEPDVKEAPGALRDLSAIRTIALLTDPLLLRRGLAHTAWFDTAEDFLLRVRSALHYAGRTESERPQPRASGVDRGGARLFGRRTACAGRAADE